MSSAVGGIEFRDNHELEQSQRRGPEKKKNPVLA